MKYKIVANSYYNSGQYAELETDAYNAGYGMSVLDNGDIKLVANDDPDNMPKITVETNKDGDKLTYDAILEFPKISTKDSYYYDDVEYYVKKWARVAKFITNLYKFSYDPSKYED